jgi:hypothetical protein
LGLSDFNILAVERLPMKSSSQLREFAPIAIGLLGMGAYQVALRLPHPAMLESDPVHGVWIGVCLGLEFTGLFFLLKRRKTGR